MTKPEINDINWLIEMYESTKSEINVVDYNPRGLSDGYRTKPSNFRGNQMLHCLTNELFLW